MARPRSRPWLRIRAAAAGPDRAPAQLLLLRRWSVEASEPSLTSARPQPQEKTLVQLPPAVGGSSLAALDPQHVERDTTALATLIRQRRLTPSCGGQSPYRGENSGPGK